MVALTGFGKDKVLRALKGLVTKDLVGVQGPGRGMNYVMNQVHALALLPSLPAQTRLGES